MDPNIKILAGIQVVGIVLILFAVFRLSARIRSERLPTQKDIAARFAPESGAELMSHGFPTSHDFHGTQYEIYMQLFGTLQELLLTVDVLWETVNKQNLANLLSQLRTTQQKTNKWSVFFEEEHLRELMRLYEVIESFRTGKLRLSEIRYKSDLDDVRIEEIKYQVEQNGEYRHDLANLIGTLRRSFHQRLSASGSPGTV